MYLSDDSTKKSVKMVNECSSPLSPKKIQRGELSGYGNYGPSATKSFY